VLYVSYNDVLRQPAREVERLTAFLECSLDTGRMAGAVDERLYRQQA
jgi:hypothetical protein